MLIFPNYRSALVSHVLSTDIAEITLLLKRKHQLFFLFWLQHMAGLGVSAIESSDDQRQLWAEQHQPYTARNHL